MLRFSALFFISVGSSIRDTVPQYLLLLPTGTVEMHLPVNAWIGLEFKILFGRCYNDLFDSFFLKFNQRCDCLLVFVVFLTVTEYTVIQVIWGMFNHMIKPLVLVAGVFFFSSSLCSCLSKGRREKGFYIKVT